MKTQRSFFLLLAAAVGLLTGLCSLLLTEERIFFIGFLFLAVGFPSLLGYLGPHRLWRYTLAASLGLPFIYVLSTTYKRATGWPSHHMDGILLVALLLLGVFCAFSGVALGIGIRKLRKKEAVSTEWKPSDSQRRATSTTLVATGIAIPIVLMFFTEPYEPLLNGVKLGEGVMKKNIFASDSLIGDVTCILVTDGGPDSTVFLIVAGNKGAMTVGPDGKIVSTLSFSHLFGSRVRMGRVEPIDIDSDGTYEYIDRGGGWGPVSLISNTGSSLWKYGAESIGDDAPDLMTPIDLDGDGSQEFVIGMNGDDGVKAFDRNGKELWSHPARNVFSVEAVDVDLDGSKEILHTDGDGIVLRSTRGEVIKRLQVPLYTFAVCKWPEPDRVILGTDDNGLKAYDFEGNAVDSLALPMGGNPVFAVPAQFGGSMFLVVGASLLPSDHQSILYLFDNRDSLVYHEVFAGREPTIAVLPAHDESGDVLLVGGADGAVTMYRYAAAGSNDSNQ